MSALAFVGGIVLLGLALAPTAAAQGVEIHEVLAINEDGLLDADGDASDWIELHHRGASPVDLDGWHLTDDATLPEKWRFPAVVMEPGGYLVVFASGKDRADPGEELHANFALSGSGEHLVLVTPTGDIASFVVYPRQHEDVSYGVADTSGELLVPSGGAVRYLVPPDGALGASWTTPEFDDSAWDEGASGVGYDVGGAPDPGAWVDVAPTGSATQSSDYSGSFGAERAIDGDFGNFTATASSEVNPYWELDLGSERSLAFIAVHNRGDGCCPSRLRDITVTLRDGQGEEVFESVLLNPENVLGGGGTAGPEVLELDLVAATGGAVPARYLRVTRTSDPDLSGTGGAGNTDEANVLSLGEVEAFEGQSGLAALLGTDVEEAMRGRSPSIYVRFPFEVDDPAVIESLDASVLYDDGFVAYLNGVEVARVNAPGSAGVPLPYDAAAAGPHADEPGASRVELSLRGALGALVAGTNVLAVHGLNASAGDEDFVIAAELRGSAGAIASLEYFETPTPGAPNDTTGVIGFVEDTTFSVDRGLFTEPFDVEIATATEGAVIRYTLDGSRPTEVRGTEYTGPIRIESTTTLRAMASKDGYRSTNVDTHTYIDPDEVLGQPVMLRDITGDATLGPQVREALTLLPSVHVTTVGTIPSTSEVPATIEFIHPDGSKGFGIDAGIKRVGGHSLGAYPKNNMRIYFRKRFGATKLRYPLFDDLAYGEGAVDEFDRLNLRGGSHDTVFYLGADQQLPSNAQYVRNRFMSDLQLEMGRLSLRGRFVHAYINGVYWGHYHLMESPSAGHIAEHMGGDKDDYEAVRRGVPIGSSAPAWNGVRATRADWDEVVRRVDIPNFVDYMLLNYWAGNAWDWRTNQNWAATGASSPDLGRYKFLCWDSDIVLRRTDDYNLSIGGPDDLFTAYLRHGEFRVELADGIHRLFFNGGLLTPERVAAVYGFRAEQVRDTLIAESARWRWGGRRWLPSNQWQRELDRLMNDFFPRRTDIVLQQMRSAGWLLPVEPPSFRVDGRALHGGWVERGALLSMSGEGSETFVESHLIERDAEVHVHVPKSGDLGDAWRSASYVEGSRGESWTVGPGGVGYDNGTSYEEAIGIDVGEDMTGDEGNTSVYVRVPFRVESPEAIGAIAQLRLDVLVDDGFVAYLNGERVADAQAPDPLTWDARATAGVEADLDEPVSFDISGAIGSLRVGENLLAVHGLNSSTNGSDMLIAVELVAAELVADGGGPPVYFTVDGGDPRDPESEEYGGPLALDASVRVRARVLDGDSWSAVSDAVFSVDEGLRITEVMYHPAPPEEGSAYVDEDFEFVEVRNVGSETVSLAGYSLGGAVTFDFTEGVVAQLAPGDVAVVVGDLRAFVERYGGAGIRIAGQYRGRLANDGERIFLRGAIGETILDFAYDDAWYPSSDGDGRSLEIVDDDDERGTWELADSWRPSALLGGSPGFHGGGVEGGRQLPSDVNQDGELDISDGLAFLRFLFIDGSMPLPCGDGTLATAGNLALLDGNGDGSANLSDAVAILNYLFLAGAPPALGVECVLLEDCPDRCGP